MNRMEMKEPGKKSILVPLTDEEFSRIKYLCEKNNLRRATLLQMYLKRELHHFGERPQYGIFVRFIEQDKRDKEKSVVIRVGEEIYSTLDDYESRTNLTKPNLVRSFIIPTIEEEFKKETD